MEFFKYLETLMEFYSSSCATFLEVVILETQHYCWQVLGFVQPLRVSSLKMSN